MEQLFDNPIALVIIAAVAVAAIGRYAWRWRRESALRGRAGERGWQPVDDTDRFAEFVTGEFPELREAAENQARSARRSGARPGGGPGVTVSVGAEAGVRSRTRGRSVYRVPVEAGELAAGDVNVTGSSGKLAQGRATVHRGAVAARLPEGLPPWRLLSRAWVDRDGDADGGDVPRELREQFSVVASDPAARATYLDSGAWEALLDAPEELDGVAVDGDRLVLLARNRLTPERVDALVGTAQRLVAAAASGEEDASGSAPRLSAP